MRRTREGFDEFGNPIGRAFDLGGGDEDRVRGERILLYICPIVDDDIATSELRQLMAERGLQLDVRHAPSGGGCDLDPAMLSSYTQLWYVSGERPTLSGQQVRMIADYVRAGNGLAIWADNDPYYADANLLAQTLIGASFSGNLWADQIMVPGGERTPGQFIEHPLTQGVNNLYEGITICTINPAPGVTVLGQSHDGQLCLGCFEREGQRIVLDTGFTKLYSAKFHKSAGLGRYLSNIAFWLAKGSRGVEYELLTPGRNEIATISKGEVSKGYQFTLAKPTTVTCILQWDGRARLGLSVRAPDGTVAGRAEAPHGPVRVSWQADRPGTYVAMVEGIDVAAPRVPYVVTLSHEDGAGPPRATGAKTVVPFYLVCDTSAAAAGTIGELNAALRRVKRDLAGSRLDDTVRISVIAYNDTARVVADLAEPSTIALPTLLARGGASYGAALREYHRAFERDRAQIKGKGGQVFRPCVFFLTTREPNDPDYAATFRSVLGYDPATQQGNRAYPTVVPIGLPGAARRDLASLAYPGFGDPDRRGRWFLARPGTSTAGVYRSVAEAIRDTVTAAHATAAQGTPRVTPPVSIAGMDSGVAS